jgi:hypothetical protein
VLYLLDANMLIDANRDYYPVVRVPEFWEWLEHMGEKGHIKLPLEIHEEIKDYKDDLAKWVNGAELKEMLLLKDEADPVIVDRVVRDGYAPDLRDDEVEKLGRDPFLIAYALSDLGERCVVTTETSEPKKQRANRKIPDVCNALGIPCYNTFKMLRELDFKTGWNAG